MGVNRMLLKALLVDDEPNILRNLEAVIPWEDLQYEVVGLARNGSQALELVREHRPDLILSDIRMPGMDGIAFIKELRTFNEYAEVLMITGYQEFEYARSLLKLGVSDYIVKPIDYEELADTIGRLGEQIRGKKRSEQQQDRRWTNVAHLCRETADEAGSSETLWRLTEDLVQDLKQNGGAGAEQALQRLNRIICSIPEQSFERVMPMLHFVALHLMREMREIRPLSGEDEERLWRKLDAVRSIPDIFGIIGEIVRLSLDAADKRKPSEALMDAAEDYMRRHIGDDFGVQEIADSLGISPSYFSLLFKQTYGATFLEQLTRLRMARAKSLLLHSDKSIAQIGQAVGYAERRYFTKVFQKYTGELPSDYRENRRGTSQGNG